MALAGLSRGLYCLAKGDITGHKIAMVSTYLGACLAAGVFTLLPNRYLGQLLWGQLLGW
jgi:uncharacterized membrane protein